MIKSSDLEWIKNNKLFIGPRCSDAHNCHNQRHQSSAVAYCPVGQNLFDEFAHRFIVFVSLKLDSLDHRIVILIIADILKLF